MKSTHAWKSGHMRNMLASSTKYSYGSFAITLPALPLLRKANVDITKQLNKKNPRVSFLRFLFRECQWQFNPRKYTQINTITVALFVHN